MKKIKVMTVLGTRPEIIRLSRVMARLDALTDHRIVHTGQNRDHELNGIFFDELGLRPPDHHLGADTSSLGAALGSILTGTERVLLAERPDAFLVLGDTNSALSAIIARRLRVPVYHMEAGNRSFDANVPEETNRKIVDHVADYNLVYTEHARRHLLSEGIHHRRIFLTGSPMREVLDHCRAGIAASGILGRLGLTGRRYFAVSLHREENVDDPARLGAITAILNDLASAYAMPVIVSLHPRTRDRLEKIPGIAFGGRVRAMKPLGFHDYIRLQSEAFCVISDSGTVAEEAAILGFPAITPRDAIERPEALDTGNLVTTGIDRDGIFGAIAALAGAPEGGGGARPGCAAARIPGEYDVPDTSRRVAKLILGTARLTHRRDGIRRPAWAGAADVAA
ncbi:MAG: non-hydrolyzing UDP-N-acetylglucosamine 2-epimerase [Paracoccaceae bacterium]